MTVYTVSHIFTESFKYNKINTLICEHWFTESSRCVFYMTIFVANGGGDDISSDEYFSVVCSCLWFTECSVRCLS